jgi:ubiquinone/menaquinone biosynthesis C-methylase UbiE
MPFENEKFDFLICTSAFKNFSEPLKALNEMHRVLKRGGKAWISDLRRDVSNETIDNFVSDTMKIKGLAGIFMKYTFKQTLRPRALTGAQFKELVARTPFTKIEITENAMDLEVLLHK